MKRIPVRHRGQIATYALVDDLDVEIVSRFTWRLHEHGYAVTDVNRHKVYMHRLILGEPRGIGVDHFDRNPLNNKRENLRLATQPQNCENVPARGGKSAHRGVFQRKGRESWFAQVKVRGKQHYLGTFTTEEDAASAAAAYRAQHMPFSADFVEREARTTPEAA